MNPYIQHQKWHWVPQLISIIVVSIVLCSQSITQQYESVTVQKHLCNQSNHYEKYVLQRELQNQHFAVRKDIMIGSAVQKINFYLLIPLPLWEVHHSIPLLNLP